MADDPKRRHDRVPFSGAVRISKPQLLMGTGIDLGAGGLAVHVGDAVAEGSPVEVELFGDVKAVQGTVRRATPHPGGGFRLGIEWRVENGHLVSRMKDMATRTA